MTEIVLEICTHMNTRKWRGRAGRRGKDTKGYVFHLMNLYREENLPTSGEMSRIMSSKPE